MIMKTKIFDCVDMKNEIQKKRMAEYESQKDKYSSYAEFIKSRSDKSKWIKQIRTKILK